MYKEHKMRFAEKLALAAGNRKQTELAELLGTTQATISRWLSGTSTPGDVTIYLRIAARLGVPLEDLLPDTDADADAEEQARAAC